MSTIYATITQPQVLATIGSAIAFQSGKFTGAAAATYGSGDTIVIPSGSVILPVSSDGGTVVLTSTPNLQTSGVDPWKLIILLGTSDTNLLTIQDENNLPNSGLHLQNARNFTLGKNDIYVLIYNGLEGIWVPLCPPKDSY